MSLKRIELQGFKSFRDKTVINFDNGYTCIVGPNGCGKSNISDAIRWVLGEQSAKQLRGENMKGVIFSGTALLPEMGYAEVTLVFDNTDHIFNTTIEELAITRRIFRNKQDNQYFVNHQLSTRSEIISLMRNTGAGKESLSIIEQGAVSNVMRVRPDQRRLIFDEAAGNVNAKMEKKKNLRSLAETEQKISEFRSVIASYDSQLGPLQKQMEAANKYRTYYNELQLLEYNMYIYKHEHADENKAKLRAHIGDLDNLIADTQKNLEAARAASERIQAQQDANDQKTRLLLEQRQALMVNRAKASGDQQTHKAKLDALNDTLAKLEADLAAATERRDNAAVELEEAKRVLQAKKDGKFDLDLEISVVNSTLADVTAELSASETDLETATSERLAEMSKLTEISSSRAKAEAQESVLRENLANADKEIAEYRRQIEEKKAAVAELEKELNQVNVENETIGVNRKKHGSIVNESRYERTDVERRIREMDGQVQTKEVNVQTLANAVREKKGYSKAVNYVVRAAASDANVGNHMVGVVSDLYQANSRYAEAIEVALGASVNHIVTRTQDDANALIEMVRSAGVGRITCMPMDKVRGETLAYENRPALGERGVIGLASDLIAYDDSFNEIFMRLLGRILIIEDFETGKRLREKYISLKMVTLDGKLFDPSGSISGGSRRTQEEVLLDRERKALQQMKDERQKLIDRRTQLEAAIEKSDTYLRESRDRQDELTEKYHELKSKIDAAGESIAQWQARIGEKEGEKAIINSRLASLRRNIADAENATGELENSNLDRDQQMERVRAYKEMKKAMRESLTERRTALSAAINAMAASIDAIERDIKRLTEEHMHAIGTVTGLDTDIATKRDEINAHVAATPALVFTEEEGHALERIDQEVALCDQTKVDLAAAAEKAAKDYETQTEKKSLAEQDRIKYEGKIEKIDLELESWADTIKTTYDKTYEEIVYAKLDDFDFVKAPGRISVLRASMTKLGNINFQAEEQFKELSELRDTQNKQLEDTVEAKENIMKLIADITDEMNNRFDTAFKQINDNFQDTFAELFGGGTAQLLLVPDPENPDEDPGVDISVQLPGKAKGPLTRLSGGEQTLTAIAILFAILKLKPMPFVVLDEAESALDDVNCHRFARFLRKYADTSKFIVITHKKPTMERADVLYGVTMEQPGVSKVVSVNLSEAVKHTQED